MFSTSFKAFVRRAVAFIILSAIAHIPYLWSSLAALHYVRARALFSSWADLLGVAVVSVVGLMCVMIAYGALIYSVIQDLAGRPVSIAEAVAIAARRLSPLVGVLVAVGPVWGLVLPGFNATLIDWLVMAMYLVVAPVCIAEQVGVGAALSRCRFLTKGHRWQIFGAILLVSIVYRVIVIGFIWGALAPLHRSERAAPSTRFWPPSSTTGYV